MKNRQRASEAGLTLTELMVSLAMMSILLVSIVRFTGMSRSGLMKQEVSAELLNRSTRLSTNLRTSLGGARLLMADFGVTPDYSSYRTWVRASIASQTDTPQPVSYTLPPKVTNARSAELAALSDSARAIWGNELLFLATMQPLTLTVQYPTTATTQTLSLDRVQFVYIYPALVKQPSGPMGQALRLVEWRSQPYVLYGSIDESTGQRLSKTCQAMAALGYTWAFDLDQASVPSAAWYQINTSAPDPRVPHPTGPSVAPRGNWAYAEEFDSVATYRAKPGVDLGRISRHSGSSVQTGPAGFVLASNTGTTASEQLQGAGRTLTVPENALKDRDSQVGFPGGFEVAIIGRPQAREVVLRHVLVGLAATEIRGGRPRLAYEGLQFISVKNDN